MGPPFKPQPPRVNETGPIAIGSQNARPAGAGGKVTRMDSLSLPVGRVARTREFPSVDWSGAPSNAVASDNGGQASGGSATGAAFKVGATALMTAAHVVENSKTIDVRCPGMASMQATVLQRSRATDVAILRVPVAAAKWLPIVGVMSSTAAAGAFVRRSGGAASEHQFRRTRRSRPEPGSDAEDRRRSCGCRRRAGRNLLCRGSTDALNGTWLEVRPIGDVESGSSRASKTRTTRRNSVAAP